MRAKDNEKRARWQRLKRRFNAPWLMRVVRLIRGVFPFTMVGFIVLFGASIALLHYGIQRLDLILLVVGSVGVALVALALVITLTTALVLWISMRKTERGRGDIRRDCGVPMMSGFSIRNLWFVPFTSVTWSWEEPRARVELIKERGHLHERIVPLRRGFSKTIRRRFEVADIFGLTKVVFSVVQERSIHFIPSVGMLKSMDVVHSIAGGEDLSHPNGPPEGERIDLRSYTTGDPVRFILWKVFARTRQVIVRTPERAIGPVRQTVAYLVVGKGDEPAAGAARIAMESGCLGGDWVLGADGDSETYRNRDIALEAISKSAQVPKVEGGTGLSGFLRTAIPGARLARSVVFVPAVPGPWVEKVVAAAASGGRPGALEFVVCCDGLVKRDITSRVDQVLRNPAETDDPSALLPSSLDDLG